MAIRKAKPSRPANVRKPSKAVSGKARRKPVRPSIAKPKDCESKPHPIRQEATGAQLVDRVREVTEEKYVLIGKQCARDLYAIAAAKPGSFHGRNGLIMGIGSLLIEQAAGEAFMFCRRDWAPFLDDALAAIREAFEGWVCEFFGKDAASLGLDRAADEGFARALQSARQAARKAA
jgi:hypothetical protein